MERVDVRLRHNVDYTGSMSQLPILVLECTKGSYLETRACQMGLKFGFFRRQTLMKLAEIYMGESGPKGRHFPVGVIPQAHSFRHNFLRQGLYRRRYALFPMKTSILGFSRREISTPLR